MSTVRRTAEELESQVAGIFEGLGFSAAASRSIAGQLVEADLRGVHSHGILLVPIYVERIKRGLVGRHETGEVVLETPAVAVIDAGDGMGQLIGRQAMALAVEKAKAVGIGAVGVRHSQHFGAAAHFALMAAQEGCIGIAVSNTSPVMPAPGGAEGVVGNNPIAIAFPGARMRPVVLDMALSQVAGGKIRLASIAGRPIPPDWATDADGVPTTDPAAALRGFFLPAGGPKGFGLALAIDALVGPLIGGTWGIGVHRLYSDLEHPHNCGHFFIALHPGTFGSADSFGPEVDRIVDHIHGARRAPGVDRLYVPGEIEAENGDRQVVEGIEIDGDVAATLDGISAELRST